MSAASGSGAAAGGSATAPNGGEGADAAAADAQRPTAVHRETALGRLQAALTRLDDSGLQEFLRQLQ